MHSQLHQPIFGLDKKDKTNEKFLKVMSESKNDNSEKLSFKITIDFIVQKKKKFESF